MNLDELKETWNDETIEQTPEVSLSEQKQLKNPLALIRKNMRKEFRRGVVLISLLILGCAFMIKDKELLVYTFSLISVGILVVTYYYSKFRNFYKEIEKPNYSTFQSLLELNYSLKNFSELYVNYYIAFVPIYLCEMMIIAQFRQIETSFTSFLISWFLCLGITGIGVFMTYKWYFNKHYGQHIAKIADLFQEVKHPYEDFQTKIVKVNRKKYLFDRTENFFTQKLGLFGKVINGIVWFLGIMIIVFGIGFIVGMVSGYLGMMK